MYYVLPNNDNSLCITLFQTSASIFNMRKPSLLQRLRAKKRNKAMVIAVTWYTEETWAQVKATASDPDCFEKSFPEWKSMAVATLREFLRSGVSAIECLIEPEEFFEWCRVNDKQNIAASRAEFVSEKLSERHNAGSENI